MLGKYNKAILKWLEYQRVKRSAKAIDECDTMVSRSSFIQYFALPRVGQR